MWWWSLRAIFKTQCRKVHVEEVDLTMKTKTSGVNFGSSGGSASHSSKTRRGRRMKKRRALKAMNETIVISDSDSEPEPEQLTENNRNNNDSDVEVIDIADGDSEAASQEVQVTDSNENILRSNSNSPSIHRASDESGTASPSPVFSPGSPPFSLPSPSSSPSPIPQLGKEQNPVTIIEDDDDDVEVVAVVVSADKSSPGSASSKRKRKRTSLRIDQKQNAANFSVTQMQGSIKKAKFMVRRTSGGFGSDPLVPWNRREALNNISTNSKQIFRGNNQRGRGPLRYFHQQAPPPPFNRNRSKEFNRRIILRPETESIEVNISNLNLTSNSNNFTSTGPFRGRSGRSGPSIWPPPPQPLFSQRIPPPTSTVPCAPGSNVMNVGQSVVRPPGTLRPIVIDGSNVAIGHGGVLPIRGHKFSARGIKVCVDYFLRRGHTEVFAFVPRFRLKKSECIDPEVLEELERDGHLRFTPSRDVGAQRIASYDDLFVVQYAHETGGVVISNDNFKDLYSNKPEWRDTIIYRLLQYTWITPDVIMFPQDPMGRNGPPLDEFLRF